MSKEVEVKFERENAEGIVPVGTYLIDAAGRIGIRFDDDCIPPADIHYCAVVVKSGLDIMSGETHVETEHFKKAGRKKNERLACQVKIEKHGEVVIMTEEKKKESSEETATTEDMNEQYRKEFAELPLEKKIANLVQLETIAFGDTVSFIVNSPFKIADKLMDVMAEFGFKKEEQQKSAARPAEHAARDSDSADAKETKNTTDANGADQA